MLSGISWKDFLVTLLVLLLVYYAIVYWIYFSKRKRDHPDGALIRAADLVQPTITTPTSIQQVQALLEQVKKVGMTKSELIYALQHIIRSEHLPTESEQQAIESIIQSAMVQMGSACFDADELAMLWKP